MRLVGFSTGALAKSDWRTGIQMIRSAGLRAVELSALRLQELGPLVEGLAEIDLQEWGYVSFHVPSKFETSDEKWVVEALRRVAALGIPMVAHPDVIFTPNLWREFGSLLLIENMDKRKPVGRNVPELRGIFEACPAARFCFDIGHARQVDPSMTEASLLLRAFGHRLAEVHISEVSTASRHDPISLNAVRAFQQVAHLIPETAPLIIESLIDQGQSDIRSEVARAVEAVRSLVSDGQVAVAG